MRVITKKLTRDTETLFNGRVSPTPTNGRQRIRTTPLVGFFLLRCLRKDEMFRSRLSLAVMAMLAISSGSVQAQSGCACPAMVPPSCSAPSCVAPTYQGCAENTGCATCVSDHSSKGSSSKCCRPLIHIDLSKHINHQVKINLTKTQ